MTHTRAATARKSTLGETPARWLRRNSCQSRPNLLSAEQTGELQACDDAAGLEYLPAVARRLLHGRDLSEPFDFLTWFE